MSEEHVTNGQLEDLISYYAREYRYSDTLMALGELKAAREEIARLKKYEPMVDDGSDRELQAMYAEIEGDE